MRGRYPVTSTYSYSFGPGPWTRAIKIIIIANVSVFLLDWVLRSSLLERVFGLSPLQVFETLALWQPITYMFLHGGPIHLLFNMLILWMFGVELERMWGTKFFTKYYAVCGAGAAATTLVLSLMPGAFGDSLYRSVVIGASGAVYGVLLAFALYFPYRPILLFMLFPIPAKYFVMILGAIALLAAGEGASDGVSHTTHLGGLAAGYLYLKGGRMHLLSELQYRYVKWKINRTRRRFDVYSGGRNDVNRRVH